MYFSARRHSARLNLPARAHPRSRPLRELTSDPLRLGRTTLWTRAPLSTRASAPDSTFHSPRSLCVWHDFVSWKYRGRWSGEVLHHQVRAVCSLSPRSAALHASHLPCPDPCAHFGLHLSCHSICSTTFSSSRPQGARHSSSVDVYAHAGVSGTVRSVIVVAPGPDVHSSMASSKNCTCRLVSRVRACDFVKKS